MNFINKNPKNIYRTIYFFYIMDLNTTSIIVFIVGLIIVFKTFDPKILSLKNPDDIIKLILFIFGLLLVYASLSNIIG